MGIRGGIDFFLTLNVRSGLLIGLLTLSQLELSMQYLFTAHTEKDGQDDFLS